MSIKSMTGYGHAKALLKDWEVSIEISSVNRKNLEIQIHLPKEWQALESKVMELTRSRLARGKVTLQISVQATNDALAWDHSSIAKEVQQLKSLCETIEVPFEPKSELVYKIAQSNRAESEPLSEEQLHEVLKLTEEALSALVQMRITEGGALAEDIHHRLCLLQDHVNQIESISKETVPDYRKLLMERLRQADLDIDLDDERILKEVAIFADRVDTSEEITRLKSHLVQFQELLSTEQAVGRKMDFLCQELIREINTIGSKANNVAITNIVIDLKSEQDRIREQVQNIE